MTARTLLFALILSAIATACIVDDDPDPTSTPLPTAPLTTPQTTPTSGGGDDSATATPTAAQADPTAAQNATPTPTPAADDPTPTLAPEQPTPTPAPAPLPLDQLNIGLEMVVDGLDQPSGFAVAGDGSNRFFILEQPGRIRVVQEGALLEEPFLDITERVGNDATEQGLLGLAFHPNYTENSFFYVNYTNNDGHTTISRFSVSGDPNVADSESESLVLFVEQPAGNHNGGHLVFGPDGYLWIGLGDGGASGDRFQNAQNPGTLLGSMLRIDVDGAEPYGVPADNPFVDDPNARSEVWATGLRNPWRYSFDSETGDLYIADVGQGEWEEISVARAGSTGGENYGWPITEGSHCYGTDSCTTDGLVQPVIEYDHSGGNCAITGGYVYRGSASPGLWGAYLYADYCSGNFWGLRLAEGGAEPRLFFQRDRALFSSFGQDEHGELYILSIEAGAVFHIVAF
jgi:glucose/arabinose dehydrogenase